MVAKKASQAIVWIILLLLIVGLAGFGATNFGGTAGALARVGETEVTAQEYGRAVQAELRNLQQQTGQSLSMAEAQAFGLDSQVLGRLIGQAALKEASRQLGLSVGDATVSQTIASNPALQGPSGSFDRDTYRFRLEQIGMNERDYEETRRAEIATDLLTGAVTDGVVTPDPFVETLFSYARETRDATWARLTEDDLSNTPAPATDDELREYYEAHHDAYMRPTTRMITYAALTPQMMVDEIDVPDDRVREAYEARADSYNRPERRLVERLVFSDDDAAADAWSRLDAGEVSYDELVAARGLALEDVDLGDVAAGDPALGEASDPIFALDEPGVVGPLKSPLGPTIYRMNAILAAQEVPYEDVADELRAALAEAEAETVVRSLIEDLDDRLASGATLEELSEETPMELGEIAWTPDIDESGVAGSQAFAEAATQTQPGDFPELTETGNGGIFALRVDEVLDPALRPLDEVREDVEQALSAERLADALEARALELTEELRGDADFGTLGLSAETAEGLMRDDTASSLTDVALSELFDMEEGEVRVVRDGNEVLVLSLDAMTAAESDTPEAQQTIRAFGASTAAGLKNDLLAAFSEALLRSAELSVDTSVLAAVNAQLR